MPGDDYRPSLANPKRFAAGSTVPTTWTTEYTVPARRQAEIVWGSFYATDTQAYTIKVRTTLVDGTTVVLGQGQPTVTGYVWQLVDADQPIILDGGQTLDIIGSGAGTVAVNFYICGREWGLPG